MDWLSALAALGSSGIASAGQLYTNAQNREFQKSTNAANMAIANQNNALAVELANTAHQREVQDLIRSGLNPILSAGGNGASVPQLRSPEMGTPQVDNPLSSFGQSAQALQRAVSQQTALENQGRAIANNYNSVLWQSADLEFDLARKQYEAQRLDADTEQLRAETENEAWRELLGWGEDDDGRPIVDGIRQHKTKELVKEGIESDLKTRTNQNWRANLGALMNGASAGAGAINSATKAARGIRALIK